jgi:predicted dehydrogenase
MTLDTMIIGCGAVAHKLYGRPLQKLERAGDIRVVAVVDPYLQQARSLQSSFPRARIYEHANDAIQAALPKVTFVLSPAHMHAEHAVMALQSGSQVLCEKPMATSVRDCATMIDSAAQSDRVLSIGMVRRFFPSFRRLKQLIEDDVLGQIRTFEYREGKRFDWDVATPAGFQKRQERGGGVLFDIGPHAIDLLLWLFGTLCVVSAEDDALAGVEANVRLQLKTSECTGLLQLSWDVPLANYLRVQGDKAEAVLPLDRFDRLAVKKRNCYEELDCGYAFPADTLKVARRHCSPSLYTDAIHCQLIQFIRSIRWGERPSVEGPAGQDCISIIEDAGCIRQPMDMDWLDPRRRERYRELQRSGTL